MAERPVENPKKWSGWNYVRALVRPSSALTLALLVSVFAGATALGVIAVRFARAANQEQPSGGFAQSDCGYITLPPAQYDHVPAIPFTVRSVNFGSVRRACDFHLPLNGKNDFRILACSWRGTVAGTIVLPMGGGWTDERRSCALRHEFGHLNGWPLTHPDAHFEGRPV